MTYKRRAKENRLVIWDHKKSVEIFLVLPSHAAEEDWKDIAGWHQLPEERGHAEPDVDSETLQSHQLLASDQHRRVTRLRIVLNSPFG